MTVVDTLFATGLTAIVVGFIGWMVWDEIRRWRAQPFDVVFTSGTNDDKQAVSRFVDIVRHATKNLIVHDDGNKMPGTIYDNPEAIEALDRQLTEHEQLVVKCLFNVHDELAMVERLRQRHPERFKVKYRRWPWPRPAFDVHYKIADSGPSAICPTTTWAPRNGTSKCGTAWRRNRRNGTSSTASTCVGSRGSS